MVPATALTEAETETTEEPQEEREEGHQGNCSRTFGTHSSFHYYAPRLEQSYSRSTHQISRVLKDGAFHWIAGCAHCCVQRTDEVPPSHTHEASFIRFQLQFKSCIKHAFLHCHRPNFPEYCIQMNIQHFEYTMPVLELLERWQKVVIQLYMTSCLMQETKGGEWEREV